jgi:FMN phosphatase YigB (HAD superfamily)
MFHAVTISEETGSEALTVNTLSKAFERLGGVKPEKAVFVGSDLGREIAIANATKMVSVRIKTGTNRTTSPGAPEEKPAFEISKLSELLDILRASACNT